MQAHNHHHESFMGKQSCKTLYLCALKAMAVILLTWTSMLTACGRQAQPENTNFPFQINLQSGQETFNLKGESELMITPSSYSINMIEDNGRCVIHMLNFSTAPGPGTYHVEEDEKVKTAMVCLLEGAEIQERLASHKGTFTITELTDSHLKGHFDMTLVGPISGKEFRTRGNVTSDITPMHLQFGPK